MTAWRASWQSLATWPRDLLLGAVRFYRFALSPWLGNACRFEPTCSAYALQALNAHGAAAGTYLTLHRIARCAPWCEGGHDPVPLTRPRFLPPALFTRSVPRDRPIAPRAPR